ncbi:MAG: ABC transporter related protein [Parcubacteria group bacterium GW2011_GWA1_36_12]|nr:MAG: ABC transporter related protein [Parcubacteria group bacterium GW2011_GWA1_36_12]
MKENPLQISHVSKIYKMDGIEFKALSDVSMTVKKGEFVAIMGPSGSGKSTLMHIIGCLDKPTSGKVLINGTDASTMNEKQLAKTRNLNIGFVFQQYNLLRRTPAIANVELPLIYARIPAGKRRQLAKAELEAVGLGDKLFNLPSQLSGGQQQRVAIARALVTNPSILLADEPTGNLDSKSGKEIMEILKNLHKQGRTIIMVTHDFEVAKNAQRMVKMVDGRIV